MSVIIDKDLWDTRKKNSRFMKQVNEYQITDGLDFDYQKNSSEEDMFSLFWSTIDRFEFGLGKTLYSSHKRYMTDRSFKEISDLLEAQPEVNEILFRMLERETDRRPINRSKIKVWNAKDLMNEVGLSTSSPSFRLTPKAKAYAIELGRRIYDFTE